MPDRDLPSGPPKRSRIDEIHGAPMVYGRCMDGVSNAQKKGPDRLSGNPGLWLV